MVLSCRLRLDRAHADSDALGSEPMLVQVLLHLLRGLLILRIASYEVSHGHIGLRCSCCEKECLPVWAGHASARRHFSLASRVIPVLVSERGFYRQIVWQEVMVSCLAVAQREEQASLELLQVLALACLAGVA